MNLVRKLELVGVIEVSHSKSVAAPSNRKQIRAFHDELARSGSSRGSNLEHCLCRKDAIDAFLGYSSPISPFAQLLLRPRLACIREGAWMQRRYPHMPDNETAPAPAGHARMSLAV